MNILNIITRCTRTTNITQVFDSIQKNNENFSIKWFVLFDLTNMSDIPSEVLIFLKDKAEIRFYESEPNDFGHDMINKTIDEIHSGLIYILDDDNIIHPNFFNLLNDWFSNHPEKDGLIFSQKIGGIDFTGLDVREAREENVQVSKIDMAQFCLKRELVSNYRFPKGYYVGDGMFIEKLFNENKDRFLIVEDIGCYYNFFKQTNVVDYFLPRVLVIGDNTLSDLKSQKYANYEDDRLKVMHIENDAEISKVLSEFKPDGIISVGDRWDDFKELSNYSMDFRRKWLHVKSIEEPMLGEAIFNAINQAMFDKDYDNNPLMSVFTPSYNTGRTLYRAYESLKSQTYTNWEWIIVDDSNDQGKTLNICKEISKSDPRVKVYDIRPKSSGIVGESKYRAASLCRGKILVELDHDDALLPEALQLTLQAFMKYPDAKFVYSDCAEIDEEHNSLTYGDNFAFGYGSYRDEYFNGRVYKAVNTQNINPKTIRHIVGVPNHLRAWDRYFYHSIGGHNRNLSIADDYELLVRTFLKTKFVRIPKMLYLQFFHNSNTQNTSRADIQRRVRVIASYYNERIKNRFEELGVNDWAYEGNPQWPINTESRFGEMEGSVNYIFNNEEKIDYDTNNLRSFSILN
jgi:glycosyltransferase involved in cell wall biosynthesis